MANRKYARQFMACSFGYKTASLLKSPTFEKYYLQSRMGALGPQGETPTPFGRVRVSDYCWIGSRELEIVSVLRITFSTA